MSGIDLKPILAKHPECKTNARMLKELLLKNCADDRRGLVRVICAIVQTKLISRLETADAVTKKLIDKSVKQLEDIGGYSPRLARIALQAWTDALDKKADGNSFDDDSGSFAKGCGSARQPFVISNAQQLRSCAGLINNCNDSGGLHFALSGDIDLGGAEWTPIGDADHMFEGVFDGNGFTIRNFTLSADAGDPIGLFGNNYGTISDVAVGNFRIDASGCSSAGGLIGDNYGTVNYCRAENDVTITTSEDATVGCLVGNNYGSIQNCEATCRTMISSDHDVTLEAGCIAGDNFGIICGSHSAGNIMIKCADDCTVTAGGLAACNHGKIETSFSSGNISLRCGSSGIPTVGGLVGDNNGTVGECCTTGKIVLFVGDESEVYAAGLIGYNFNEAEECYSCAAVSVTCENDCTVSAGGLIGENSEEVSRCFSASTVSVHENGDDNSIYAGGIVGYTCDGGRLSESFYEADQLVTVSGDEVCIYDGTPYYEGKEGYKSLFLITLKWSDEVWMFEKNRLPKLVTDDNI